MSLEGKQLGHYHVLHLIGSGGMGEVYLAEDHRVRRQVAVKIIKLQAHQEVGEAEERALRLFLREATTIAQLDHPGILPLYDYGEEMIDGEYCAYLITPYRAEGALTAWLHKRAQAQSTQQLTLKQVAHLVGQAAVALQYAHDHQIVHQDVKPANFLLRSKSEADEYPDLLLADFGIARLTTATASASQQVRGTPTYMAPEQWAGSAVFSSDQYALAVMTYELLTGIPPFQGAPMTMMYAHLHQAPRPPRELNALLPAGVDAVLLRALAKRPEQRFPSVTAFAQALAAAFQGIDEDATLRVLRPAPPTPSSQRNGSDPSAAPVAREVAGTVLTPTRLAAPFSAADPPTTMPVDLSPTSALPHLEREPRRRSPARLIALLAGVALVLGGSIFAALGPLHLVQLGGLSQTDLHATATANASDDGSIATSLANATSTANASLPGMQWKSEPLSGADAYDTLKGIVWSGQLSQYVMVGYALAGVILTSPDGETWTPQAAHTSQFLDSVVWSSEQAQYVAVGTQGTILTSPDGKAWTTQPSPTQFDLLNVAWSGSQYVATGQHGTILTSPDGKSWTAQNAGTTENIIAVAWANQLAQFVAVGDDGVILTSPDGKSWTAQNANVTTQALDGIVWTDSEYVVVGDAGTILTSPDGKSWSQQTSNTETSLNGIVQVGSEYIAVGGDMNGIILTSPNGQVWKSQLSDSGISQPLQAIAWSGAKLVAIGYYGTVLISQ